jgi:hypothetical protein
MGIGMAFGSSAGQWAAIRAWGPEVAGSAAGTQSMMRYVGSVAGAAMMAAVLGAHPGVADVRALFWLVAAAGGANLLIALTVFRGRSALSHGASTQQVTAAQPPAR